MTTLTFTTFTLARSLTTGSVGPSGESGAQRTTLPLMQGKLRSPGVREPERELSSCIPTCAPFLSPNLP